ncbi:MAG: 30S ribosome-binding factor RbfA [Acidimicrobiales bacterium]
MSPRSRPRTRRQFPRTARVSHLVQEILAEQLTRIDDERLLLVTVTDVDIDADLSRAIVFFDSPTGPEGDETIIEALEGFRHRLQAAVNREARLRRTPMLVFKPDPAIRGAARIDQILHRIHRDEA